MFSLMLSTKEMESIIETSSWKAQKKGFQTGMSRCTPDTYQRNKIRCNTDYKLSVETFQDQLTNRTVHLSLRRRPLQRINHNVFIPPVHLKDLVAQSQVEMRRAQRKEAGYGPKVHEEVRPEKECNTKGEMDNFVSLISDGNPPKVAAEKIQHQEEKIFNPHKYDSSVRYITDEKKAVDMGVYDPAKADNTFENNLRHQSTINRDGFVTYSMTGTRQSNKVHFMLVKRAQDPMLKEHEFEEIQKETPVTNELKESSCAHVIKPHVVKYKPSFRPRERSKIVPAEEVRSNQTKRSKWLNWNTKQF